MPHGGPDGRWIKCDATGHCEWTGREPLRVARRRLFEASRGDLPKGVTVETTCGVRACVNLDHLRVTRPSSAVPMCRRGHELTAANVVRHRDGRIAYCRTCRNDRRRELYQRDTVYPQREVERQRRRRSRS